MQCILILVLFFGFQDKSKLDKILKLKVMKKDECWVLIVIDLVFFEVILDQEEIEQVIIIFFFNICVLFINDLKKILVFSE